MGLIDIFRNGFVTFRNVTQHSAHFTYPPAFRTLIGDDFEFRGDL